LIVKICIAIIFNLAKICSIESLHTLLVPQSRSMVFLSKHISGQEVRRLESSSSLIPDNEKMSVSLI
jgi:hypothetical protein